MLHIKRFGLVSVYTTEEPALDRNGVEINWPSIGAVGIERAEVFATDLAMAITFAQSERERLASPHRAA